MSRTAWILILFIIAVRCHNDTDDWPPAVSTVHEITALHRAHTAVRCIGCGNEEVRALAETLKDLDYLVLDTTANLTDDGFAQLADIDKLRYLIVDDASSLSGSGLEVLAAGTRIKELYLDEATTSSPEALVALCGNPSVERVVLCNAPQITDDLIEDFRVQLPDCDIQVVSPPCLRYPL